MTKNSANLRVRLPALIFALEVMIIVLYAVFVTYDDHTNALLQTNMTKPMENAVYQDYPFFADIQMMIFIGFGCLLSFFQRYGFGGMVFNFLTATFAIQWAILIQGFFHFYYDGKIHLGVINLINAEFACAVVLISFGAVLGKTSPVQLLVSLFEILFEVCKSCSYLKINDAGGSILIHVFACYFGLGVTFILYRPSLNDGHSKECTSYQSDMLSVLGTLFLWVFWPSFNCALTLRGDDQHRAILHTFIGLSASTLTAFALSAMLNKNGKLSMADVQNVTLAGGVTVGASVDMMITPAAAYALGMLGCTACMLGYKYLSPFLARRLRVQDQCGIHNLHGLTGLISTVAAIYPQLAELQELIPGLKAGLGRTAKEQALYQLAALGSTIALAAVGGMLTGLLLKLPYLASPSDEFCFDDELFFNVPADYNQAPVLLYCATNWNTIALFYVVQHGAVTNTGWELSIHLLSTSVCFA
uniref:Ammonium transporter AmtB-like domain-containing protein n=1 Tax=Pygocentrus nattereri TaxID=42514 RepID=A0AAR2LVV0_PYGNA